MIRWNRHILWLVFFLLTASAPFVSAKSRYFQTYTLRDGFPSTQLNSLISDRQGYLWMSTDDGLIRFDGTEFIHIEITDNFEDNQIYSLFEDSQGNLWAGMDSGWIYRFDGVSWTDMQLPGIGNNSFIKNIVEGPDGRIWLCSFQGGLFYCENQLELEFIPLETLPSTVFRALHVDRAGHLWVAAFNGVMRYNGEAWDEFHETDGLNSEIIRAIYEDTSGVLWFGGFNGISSWDGQKFQAYTEAPQFQDDYVTTILEDDQGRIWCGLLHGGVLRFDGTTFEHLTGDVHASQIRVRALAKDFEGNIWCGNLGNGLSRYRGDQSEFISASPTYQLDRVLAIGVDRQEHVWFGGFGDGITRYDGQSLNRFDANDDMPLRDIRTILCDRQGILWFGSHSDGLTRYDGKQYRQYTQDDGLLRNRIVSIHESRDGTHWLGSIRGGLSHLKNNQISTYTTTDGLPSNDVIALHEDPQGVLWIGSPHNGVTSWDGESFRNYTMADGLAGNHVNAIQSDSLGGVWVATLLGITRMENGRMHNYTIREASDRTACRFLVNYRGYLFAGTDYGLYQYRQNEDRFILWQHFSSPLILNEQLKGAAAIDSRGLLMCAVFDGVVQIDLNYPPKSIPPPPVYFTSVLAQGRPLPMDSVSILPAAVRDISIHYSGLSYIAPHLVRYQYRLVGDDPGWKETTERYRDYQQLPPGAYTFEVRAQSAGGSWSPHPAEYSFVIARLLWAQWWFRVCMIGVLACVLVGYHQLRVRTIRRQRNEFEAAVHSRTEELRSAKETVDRTNRELENIVQERTAALQRVNEQLRAEIGERHQVESELRYRSATIHAIVQNMPVILYRLDAHCVVTECFGQGLKRIGQQDHAIVGENFVDIFPQTEPYIRKALGGETVYFEMDGTLGGTGWSFLHCAFPDTELAGGALGFAIDVTDRKSLEQQLNTRQRLDSLGTLAGGIAHDFNNLLAGIVGNLGLLQQTKDELNDSQQGYLENAETGCTRAAELIRQFQLLSRGSQTEEENIDLYDVVAEVFSFLSKTTDRMIEKELALPPGRYFVRVNRSECHQVFLNLGTNAVQALEDRGLRPGAFVRVLAEYCKGGGEGTSRIPPGEFVHVTVSDNGVGMSEDIRARIFEPMFTTRQHFSKKGQGLGLAMVYKIVSRSGHIEVESRAGVGTIVHVYLPRGIAVQQPKIEEKEVVGGTETILIIEDEDMVRDVARHILENEGYRVLATEDGQSGIETYLKHRKNIDLILLDLTMPRMSGQMVMERLLEEDKDVKVVITTGHSDEDLQDGVLRHAQAFISKPFKPSEYLKIIRSIIDGTNNQQQA
jgi:ligand-binding sensor domain-containing protein/signal transduction histidine kinase/CheY-like chemotaxis protein